MDLIVEIKSLTDFDILTLVKKALGLECLMSDINTKKETTNTWKTMIRV